MTTLDERPVRAPLTRPSLQEQARGLERALEDAIKGAFQDMSATSQAARTDRWALSLSGLGRCLRQAVYRLAAIPPSDPERDEGEARMAHLGTWIHLGFLPYLATRLGGAAITERSVVLRAGGRELPGRMDLWRARGGIVTDLKTVHSSKFDALTDIDIEHLFQVWGYALACAQAGEQVRWICVIYMSRDTGETRVFVRPWTPADSAPVIDQVLQMLTHLHDPSSAPPLTAAQRQPKASVCEGCAWLSRCKPDGYAAGAAPWRPRRYTRPHIEAHLLEDLRIREQIKDLEERRKVLQGSIVTSHPGQYGRAQWKYTQPKKPAYDGTAARARATQLRQRAAALLKVGGVSGEIAELLTIAAAPEPTKPARPSVLISHTNHETAPQPEQSGS